MNRLEGKVALISGTAKGQGAEKVALFAAEGAQVIFGDILDDLGLEVEKKSRPLVKMPNIYIWM
ncbi:MAG: NAD(P)-dependent dehydrogenase, short-chain alcohol dehydrogenase family [Chloroflexi bacterium]|jgi:NAD(P)-dependent dehydrogenase (short-subunit alcohol dehydrogenase family)|nr:MAG: NAD(P)-dependent dehydrogenase, short-chain alcohol dehydrogenase family [Chloroflexota bacterium]